MEIIPDNHQPEVSSSHDGGHGNNKTGKTALQLFEELQNSLNKTDKIIKIDIENELGRMTVTGVEGPVKIFNHSRKLLLICTASDNLAHFKIGHLKKGRYLLEAEHRFFEFSL